MKRMLILASVLAVVAFGGAAVAAGIDITQVPQMLHALWTPENASMLMLGNVAGAAGLQEIKALIQAQGEAWEEFKRKNDALLAAKADGKAVGDLTAQMAAVNKAMDELHDLQRDLAVVNERMAGLQLAGGPGDVADAAREMRIFAMQRGVELSLEDYQNYKSGMNTYLRMGHATPAAVMAAMSVGSDPDGGYTVTPDMGGRIATKVYETSPMRQVATVDTINTDALEGFNDLDEADSGWVGETQDRDETDTPQIGKWSIPVHEIFAQPKTTQKLLDDSAWDVEAWLIKKVAERFSRQENAGFFTGDGVIKPRGLCTYTTVTTTDASRAWGQMQHINSGASGAFAGTSTDGDKLIDLVYAVKAAYRANARFMMPRLVLAEVRKLKDGDGNYLWQPNFQARDGGLLLSYPVVEAEDMPALAANSLSIAFGDFREAYQVVDRQGIRVLRDPYTTKGRVKFYTTKRTGGGVVNFEAVKFLRFGS